MSYFPPPLPGQMMMPPPFPLPPPEGLVESPGLETPLPRSAGQWAGVLACWLLILGSIASVIWMDYHGPAGHGGLSSPDAGLKLEMSARYAVGCKVIFNGLVVPSGLDMDVRGAAVSNLDRLRTIPVIGELQGDAAAVKEARDLLRKNLSPQVRQDTRLLLGLYLPTPKAISQADRDGLIARHGWFGELAVSHSAPADDPVRRSAEGAAIRAVVGTIVMVGLLLLFLAGGLALLIVLLIQFGSGRLLPRFRPATGRTSDVLLEGFTVWMIAFVTMEIFMRHLPAGSGIAWEGLLAVPFLAAVVWIRVRGVEWGQMADALGWRKGEGIFREALAGVTIYIAGVPVLAAATAVTALLTELAGTNATHPIVQGVHASAGVKAFLFFLACIFAPITEETLFRGMLLGHLRFRHSWAISAIVVSVIFAAIHPQGWTAIPVLATVAMILSVLREQRKSLIGPMTAHAMNNTLILVMLFLVAG